MMIRALRPLGLVVAVWSAGIAIAGCGSADQDPAAVEPETPTSTSTTATPSSSTTTSTTTSSTTPVAPTTTWIPIGVDCSSQPLPRFETTPDPRPTPEEAVRWWGDQSPKVTAGRVLVRPDDEVRRVGDPAAVVATYVSVRAGTPVATFGVYESADGWRATPWEGCRRDLP